ncbi:MAG: TonB-dependent receptor [Opitutaceae bacterium]|nr:TonB-dependent receptor [Opitutaceae bacterium]
MQAATGVITGKAINAANGAAVAGATIRVVGLADSVTSDLNGAYRIPGVPAGTLSVTITKEGFQPLTISSVALGGGETEVVEVPLAPASDVLRMEAFSISADTVANSDIGLLSARQKAVAVSDAIGSEQLSRLAVGNAAEAMSKMTGASLVDGRYAVIRGLGDRYTNTQMNGFTLPSADPDRRAVQLDQFPSELIDSITTTKSFTPDQPGAFSGGSVNLKTKSFPEQSFATLSIGTACNSNVTGGSILTVPGGGRDGLGRDDGTRALSSAVPNPMPSNLTTTTAQLAARMGDFGPAQQLDAISKGFHNSPFFPRPARAAADFGFNAAIGDTHRLRGDQVFGYVASLTYSRTSDHFTNGITGRYSQGSVNPADPRFVDLSRVFTTNVDEYKFAPFLRVNPNVPGGPPAFGVTRSAQNVDWGAYVQLAWRPSLNHEITTTVFHNQSAQDQVKRGVGEAVRSDSGGEFRENYDLLYTERGMTSVQLAGRTNLPAWNDAKVEWRAAVSRSTQDQPDYRSLEFKWSFILQDWDPSGLNNYRYFRGLEERATDVGLDFTRSYELAGGRELTLKAGGARFESDRTNRERAFVIQSPFTRTRAGIENFPGAIGITAETANAVTFGTVMREISANLNYNGEQVFGAGYAMGDLRLNEQWRLIGGVRFERTEMLTTSLPGSTLSVRAGEIRQTDPLPSLGVVWSPWRRHNLRFSYGRTLARPTFRELADVVNYEPFTDEFIGGNPELELTVIDNLDLRWEWFPRRSEVIAASLFHKQLDRPIERVFAQGRIFPHNVEEGVAYGVEFEARRRLDAFLPALNNVSVGFNASWIRSEVTIPAAELALIRAVYPNASDKRALFGQSPFIVNVDATYELPRWGSVFTTAFSESGRRLDLVASGALPDVYEQPAPGLDFIWAQRISDRWRLKFTARNLLDSARKKSLQYGGVTHLYERFQTGRKFSLSLSYAFH